MAELPVDVRRLFEGANYAHIATLLPDGGPHSVPLWVGLEGDRIAVLTSPDARKARNVARDPRVAISITDHAQPFAMALVRGQERRMTTVLTALATSVDTTANDHSGEWRRRHA